MLSSPVHPSRGPGACCHVYFTFTRGVNTVHIVNIFVLGCHVFLEKLNRRKTNRICLHFYRVQHFPFHCSLCSQDPASPFTSSNKLNLSGRASPAGSKFLRFHLPGKNAFVLLFLKGGFHWGQDSWLKGIYPLCQHREETTSVCQGSHSFWGEVLCSFGLGASSGTESLPGCLEEFYLYFLLSNLTILCAEHKLFILLGVSLSNIFFVLDYLI